MGEFPSGEIQKLETSGAARWEYKLKTNPKGQMNRIIFFILSSVFLLKLVEILLHLFALMLSETQYQSFRSFPLSTFTPIEAIFLVLIEKQYRNLLIVIIRTLPRFLTLLFFLGIGVFLYTVLGLFVIFLISLGM